MNIFNIFTIKKGFGALLDTREEEEKAKDYKLEEIVASVAPVNWVEKPEAEWRKFPITDQNGSGSCVAQTVAKLLGIMHYIKDGVYIPFSATDVYNRRSNAPSAGMIGVDALNIAREGVTLEALLPSQGLSDLQMTGLIVDDYKVKVGEIFKVSNFIIDPVRDIDTIASIIQQTGKGVMVWFYFENNGEWSDVPTVKGNVDLYGATTNRHSVTAIDTTMYNGEKALIIDDSWGNKYGKAGQRIITESFFKERNYFSAHLMNFEFDVKPIAKVHEYTQDLTIGSRGEEVVILQNRLKAEGHFPTNVESSGYFGSITKKAVIKYQLANGITPPEGFVGSITRGILNK